MITALEEAMYGTNHELYKLAAIYYMEKKDVVKVAKALKKSDCRKLVIMRPSSVK